LVSAQEPSPSQTPDQATPAKPEDPGPTPIAIVEPPQPFVGKWEDSFAQDQVPPFRDWSPIRVHDTRSDAIEIKGGRLRLALDTLQTKDETVKLRGVRSRRFFQVPQQGAPLRVTVTLDWNQQLNGSYLTLGFALLPAGAPLTSMPHRLSSALAFEWVGVPPGKFARPFLWERRSGGLRSLYTEGWPQPRREDRKGRLRATSTITLEARRGQVRLFEGKKLLHEGPSGFAGPCRLLLFTTGHSNYPERSVSFHDVRVEAPPPRASESLPPQPSGGSR
tara:strand:+ start:464 stop:1294 length:831 start_codon:yes stop_codon:yes gene_type:complete